MQALYSDLSLFLFISFSKVGTTLSARMPYLVIKHYDDGSAEEMKGGKRYIVMSGLPLGWSSQRSWYELLHFLFLFLSLQNANIITTILH